MTKEKECSYCKETFPETEEFFYKNNGGKNFRKDCKYCFDYKSNIRKKEKKLQQEKDQWKEQHQDQVFICKICGQPKKFEEMRKDASKKAIEKRCNSCYNKQRKEVYRGNYKANIYAQVLKERRENENGINEK